MLFSSTTSTAPGTITVRMTRSWGDRRPQRSVGASTLGNARIPSLLEAALTAASDDLQWPIFLNALSSALRASTMSLFLSDPVGHHLHRPALTVRVPLDRADAREAPRQPAGQPEGL